MLATFKLNGQDTQQRQVQQAAAAAPAQMHHQAPAPKPVARPAPKKADPEAVIPMDDQKVEDAGFKDF
jgi:hypothetical protein